MAGWGGMYGGASAPTICGEKGASVISFDGVCVFFWEKKKRKVKKLTGKKKYQIPNS